MIFGDTKNKKNRVIDIADTTANALKTDLNLQNQNKLLLNDIYHHDLNLVSYKKDGSPHA